MLQGITSDELINSKNINAVTYPSLQYATTTDYESQLSGMLITCYYIIKIRK